MAAADEQFVQPDADEAIGDIDELSSTASLRSSILEHKSEYGRQYHSYKDADINYIRPNDEAELDRLDIMHEMFTVINDGKLHLAPIGTAPGRILDVGAGTGLWCISMGDLYPMAEVIGVDISPSMPTLVPTNVRFEVDDAEEDWTYSQPFDYVHGRYMAAAIKDWPRLIQQCYENTKPGGWCEFQDFDIDYYSQDGTLTEEHALRRWLTILTGGLEKLRRRMDPGKFLEQWFKEAGFVNVQAIKTPLPLGPWPKDKKLKQIGIFNWAQLIDGLQGLSLRVYIGLLGWTREDLELLLVDVRKDLRDKRLHAMFDCYTVWGQRPAN